MCLWGSAMLSLPMLCIGGGLWVLSFAGDSVLRWLCERIVGLSLSMIAGAGGSAVLLKGKPWCGYAEVGPLRKVSGIGSAEKTGMLGTRRRQKSAPRSLDGRPDAAALASVPGEQG